MISSWRRKRRSTKNDQVKELENISGVEMAIPSSFRCPISLDLMKDPVTLSTGISYDRQSIETWIENGSRTCPITNQTLVRVEPIPNHTLRKMIQSWCVENSSYGFERIPTPKTPLTSFDALDTLRKVENLRKDRVGCKELVSRMSLRMKESEKSKKCFELNGARGVLGAAFESFASSFDENNESVLIEILATLGHMFPLDDNAKVSLSSPTSTHCLVRLLKNGDLSTRRNAVMALRDMASSNESWLERFVSIEGSIEECYKLIEKPICSTSAKASLMIMFYIISSAPISKFEPIISNLVQLGLVSLLVDILVGSDKSMSEKVLGILDNICDTKLGLQHAYENVLTMPVLVKKILRVSDLATEFSVSVIWKLSKNDIHKEGYVLVEALQVGAFQKLLLLLQVGCSEKTKVKATELLKMLNVYRESWLECIDSMDFKNLKRSI